MHIGKYNIGSNHIRCVLLRVAKKRRASVLQILLSMSFKDTQGAEQLQGIDFAASQEGSGLILDL